MTYNITPYQKAYMDAHQIPNDPVMELDVERVLYFGEIWRRQKPDASEKEIEAHAIGNAAAEAYGIPKGAAQDAAREFLDSQRIVKVFEATRFIHGEQLPELIDEAKKIEPALSSLTAAVVNTEVAVQQVASAVRAEGAEFDIFLVQQLADLKQAAWKWAKWVIGWGIAVAILLSVIAIRAHAQIDVIRVQDNVGGAVGTIAAPFTFKAGANCTWSKSASTYIFNCAGGSSSVTGTGYWHNTTGSLDAAAKLFSLTASTDVAANQGTTTTVLHGNAAGQPAFSAVVEADQTLADNTTNNASTSAHGYLKKLSNVATQYMDGTGNYSVPAGNINTGTLNGAAYYSTTTAISSTTAGTMGQELTSNGSGSAPTYQPRIYSAGRKFIPILPNTAGGWTTVGESVAEIGGSSCSNTAATSTDGFMCMYTTGVTINTARGIAATGLTAWEANTATKRQLQFYTRSQINSAAEIQNFIGLTDQTAATMLAAAAANDNPAGNWVGFIVCNTAGAGTAKCTGNGSNSVFTCAMKNATTATYASSAVSTDTATHSFQITEDSSGNWNYYIDGTAVCGAIAQTNKPLANTLVRWVNGIQNLIGSDKRVLIEGAEMSGIK